MLNQARPNLFYYATSELSQDAFICWLAAWADPKFSDSDLHQIARQFIISLIHKHKPDYNIEKIETLIVRRQVEKLDILIEINKEDTNEKLAILIEDKTHTDHHSGQLGRYYENAGKEYTIDQVIPIYFKTGYQSKFNVGLYKTYLRKEFLELLGKGKGTIQNAIYDDFLAHLENMEYVVNQYSTKNLFLEDESSGWNENDWRGFFIYLYNNRDQFYEVTQSDEANWNYIANPKGGFFGFWWYFKNGTDGFYRPYLQLENNSLCFKIEVIAETNRSWARDEAHRKLMEAAYSLAFNAIRRPDRMGNGRYMTVAKWAAEPNGKDDYREMKEDGTLNFNATLENLKKAQQILDTAFPQ